MGIIPVSERASWNASFGGPGAMSGPLSGPWYSTHKTQFLGVLLAAASDLLISVSLNIQKCAHLRLVCQTELKPYYTSKLWWCGITLLGLGEVGNFAAYGFAPITLVTPLGCVSVIGSAFISVVFLKKTMKTADILGGTLTVTGTYLLVTFAPNVPQELTARQVQNYLVSWPFLVYSILLCLVLKGGPLVVHQAAKNHGRIVWLLGSTRFGHRTAISVPTPLLLLGLPQEAEADMNTDLCTPSRAAIRDSYVLLIIFLGCFLSGILEILIFCILLYFYKRKAVKHIVVLLMMVALLASMTVIAVKAVSSMITLSVKGKMQLTYSIFYIMVALMATSCAFQVKFLNQAMHLYEATAVVPINFVFFTTSAIISGVIFYREFQSAAFLSVFMFLFGCLLSFLGVFIIARNKKEEHLQIPFIDCGHIPGHKLTGKIQPDSHSSRYGTLNKEDDLVKSQS